MRHIRILALIVMVVGYMPSIIGSAAFGQQAGKQSEGGSGNAALEKELFELDQKWLEAARTKDLDFLKQAWTDNFLELMPGFEPVSKPELLDLVANTAWSGSSSKEKGNRRIAGAALVPANSP